MKYIYFLLSFLFAGSLQAKTYNLIIKKEDVFITGKPIKAITINGTIPGPTLTFTEGEEAIINVKNELSEATSIHWHGILLAGDMDGVPGLNGFKGIKPGETFTYKFKIRQAGTYWYHSHSNFQEQEGLYGPLIIHPKKQDNQSKVDREYFIMLSDFTEESPSAIVNNLKGDAGYYNYNKRTVGTFFKDIKEYGFFKTLKNYKDWGMMKMDPTDIADVTNYYFLLNGKRPDENPTFIFKKGEKVKLRFVNAAAMTIFDVFIPNLKMKVVEADGQPVKPLTVDEFRLGNAESYDVIIEPKEDAAYTIVAQSIDRTGYARATLATEDGLEGVVPEMRKRTILTMADMNMEGHSSHNMKEAGTDAEALMHMDHASSDDSAQEDLALQGALEESDALQKSSHNMDMAGMYHSEMIKSGWTERGSPAGSVALEYKDLSPRLPQKDKRDASREIEFKFGGSMERYLWTINGEKFPKPMKLKYGERVRLKFINETMMAHPIHLHGMFMQLENGNDITNLPNKHTVLVPPAQTITVLLTVDEEGEWAFHCHLLYHMGTGMMTSVTVEKN